MPPLENLVCAIVSADDPTEFTCESSDRPGVTHKQSLRAYRYNGRCTCENFTFKLEGIVARGITPAQAVVEEMVTLKPGQRLEDALRCKHLIESRWIFADVMVEAFDKKAKNDAPQNPF